ncbi:MAG TPA: hypothetical protein VGI86_11375 [Acidimicrobiia bacterium]|jgi:hypothetical protein
MHNLLLDVFGVGGGVAVYGALRATFGRFGAPRRNARAAAGHQRVDGMLAPYEGLTMCPIPVRDELPANVLRLRPRSRD